MAQQSLNVSEVIRLANHDYLNQLHLIGMHLDLGNIDSAKTLIHEMSTQYQCYATVQKLGLPQTMEWFQTLKWRYPAFHTSFSIEVTEKISTHWDERLTAYLEKTMLHVDGIVDAFSEQHVHITIAGAAEHFRIELAFTGRFETLPHLNTEWKDVHIETRTQTNTAWHIIWQDRE